MEPTQISYDLHPSDKLQRWFNIKVFGPSCDRSHRNSFKLAGAPSETKERMYTSNAELQPEGRSLSQTCYRQNMRKFESAHIGAQGFNFLKMSKFEPLTGPSGLSLPIHVCMPEVLWKFPVCEPIENKN